RKNRSAVLDRARRERPADPARIRAPLLRAGRERAEARSADLHARGRRDRAHRAGPPPPREYVHRRLGGRYVRLVDELATAWRTALTDDLPGAIALRHDLHRDPRVSGAEDPTADRVVAALDLPAERIAGTGRLLRIGPDGPAVGLRAEMDALPMAERTGA